MPHNVRPPRRIRSKTGLARGTRGPFIAGIVAIFFATPGCEERRRGPPERSPFLRPLIVVSASARPAPPASVPSAFLPERPPEPEPDPAAPPGDLRAEIDAFQDLRACARAHRMADPMLADAVDALGYDTFVTDACRTIEALKAQSTAPCAPVLSTALRLRCEAQVAMLAGRPELCPADEPLPGFLARAPLCLAAARRDVRPCVSLLGLERAACEGLAAHDPARCGVDERCLRLVRRWMTAIPVAIGRPIHPGQIRVETRGEGPASAVELPREAEVGAWVSVAASGKARLLIGDLRAFLVAGEDAGGGLLLDLPSWPPRDLAFTLSESEARVTLRLRSAGALELTHLSRVKVAFEAAPAEPNRPLKLSVEASVGPSHAPRRASWFIDTWLRDIVAPARPASSASSTPPPPPAPAAP